MSNPVVVYAGAHHFAPDESMRYDSVHSRMVLWVESGHGSITVNGEQLPVAPRAFYVLPWNHTIEYLADSADPLVVGGVHVVPDYRGTGPPTLDVHRLLSNDDEQLLRHDARIPGLGRLHTGHFSRAPGLRLLVDYVIHWWYDPDRAADDAFALGRVVVSELQRVIRDGRTAAADHDNAVIRRIVHAFRQDPARHLTVGTLASVAGCSTATLNRLVRSSLGLSTMAWIREERLQMSRESLLKTERPVKAIADDCGFGDQYQFSKAFRARFGVSPSAFRRRYSTLFPER